jgi:preprotein translocase subunit SecG
MLTFFIYLLTAVLVIDCIFLVLLVLVQLPKKEAGMGQAFGGAATDALFGAGSGNVLTKATKWGAGLFLGLAIALTVMGAYNSSNRTGRLQEIINQNKQAPAAPVAPAPSSAATPAPATPATPAPVVPAVPTANPPANAPAAPAR